MEILSFPHRFDRYRLIALIFRHLSKRLPNFKQNEMERLAGIDQSTISRLLSLNEMRAKAKQGRGLNRSHLLAVSRKGFRLNHRQATLILWLAEGLDFKPWRDVEFKELCITPPDPKIEPELEQIRHVNAFRSDHHKAHAAAVALVKEVCVVKTPADGWHKIKTNIIHGNGPEDRLALYQKLRDMEYRGGQRMLVSKYPTILVSSDILAASRQLRETPEPIRTQLRTMLIERQKNFEFNLRKFGERAIHSVASIRRFVNPDFKHHLHVEERRKIVWGLIRYLNNYERFQVGLIPEVESVIEPEVEIAIKSTREAVVRGTARELSNHPWTVVCGPSYLHWDDEWAVLAFYLDFENEWAKLQNDGYTDKKFVLQTLRDIMGAAHPHSQPSGKPTRFPSA